MKRYTKKSIIKSIAVAAVNEEGRSIFSNVDLNNKTLEEAIMEIVSEINEQGYILEDETPRLQYKFSNNDNMAYELEAK